MKRNHLWALCFLALLTPSCSSDGDATPGDGESFNTIFPQPSDLEFWVGFKGIFDDETSDISPFSRIRALQKSIGSRNFQTVLNEEDESVQDCDTDGTIELTRSGEVEGETESEEVGELIYTYEFKDCRGILELEGGDFDETLNGLDVVTVTLEESTGELTIDTSISASGDLGFALNCEMRYEYIRPSEEDEEPISQSGQCRFTDAQGNAFTISIEDLGS